MSAHAKIAALLTALDAKGTAGEILWRIRSDDGRIDVTFGNQDQPFFIASATKLFVTAILAQLRDEGKLDWDAPVATYLPNLDLVGLCSVDGDDRSTTMSIRSVMSHTAGLADYFEGKRADGGTTIQRAIAKDFGWDVDDVLDWTRPMRPGKPGKGLYSDTGYQLLGALIERVESASFADVVSRRIAAPLALANTYVFGPSNLSQYDGIASMRDGVQPLRIPLAMASVQADGGIVSTVNDAMTFLDAFFGGKLFPIALLDEMATDWHPIFPPLEYGTGVMRFAMSPVFTGFRKVPALVGHSGASGTVMFRSPDTGISVVGTVNQIRNRSIPYQLMIRAILFALPPR